MHIHMPEIDLDDIDIPDELMFTVVKSRGNWDDNYESEQIEEDYYGEDREPTVPLYTHI